jgi:hypothetical protein
LHILYTVCAAIHQCGGVVNFLHQHGQPFALAMNAERVIPQYLRPHRLQLAAGCPFHCRVSRRKTG